MNPQAKFLAVEAALKSYERAPGLRVSGRNAMLRTETHTKPEAPSSITNPTITVPISSWDPVWFGDNIPAGIYRIARVSGVVGFREGLWGLGMQFVTVLADADRYIGPQILTTAQSAVASTSPNVPGRIYWKWAPFPAGRWETEQAATQDATGQTVTFRHPGGPIGMALYDSPYTDNIAGAEPLRFTLSKVK